MERLLTPPQFVEIPDVPLVFLAGPIQGAPDWQTPLAGRLLANREDLFVASPRRPVIEQADFVFEEQVDWEEHYIDRALKLGVVAFWFAAQDHSLDYEQGRLYAQTSRIELGDVLRVRKHNPLTPLAIGFDAQYKTNGGGSERYFRHKCAKLNIAVAESIEQLTNKIEILLLGV